MTPKTSPVRITAFDLLAFVVVAPIMVAWYVLGRLHGTMRPTVGLPTVLWRMARNRFRHRLSGPLTAPQPESGHCFVVQVPAGMPDDSFAASELVLYEDDVPLGPAHSEHNEIRMKGSGRYSHWNGWIFFSTRDNSDPRTNGRAYRFAEVRP